MKIDMISGESIDLDDKVAAVPFNEALVHELVVGYLSGARTGDKKQKTRSEVSGGGKKPWRQKGTGRARAGTIRSPIWVGGGRAFATRAGERNFKKKINRKAYRSAMRSILSELIRQNRVVVVSDLNVDKPNTKAFKATLGEWGVKSGLVVCSKVEKALYLSGRNLPGVEVLEVGAVDPVSLLQAEKLVCTKESLKGLEERLAG